MADEIPPFSGDFAAGTQVAGYLLREQIGWGGMAAVYRAYAEPAPREIPDPLAGPAPS